MKLTRVFLRKPWYQLVEIFRPEKHSCASAFPNVSSFRVCRAFMRCFGSRAAPVFVAAVLADAGTAMVLR